MPGGYVPPEGHAAQLGPHIAARPRAFPRDTPPGGVPFLTPSESLVVARLKRPGTVALACPMTGGVGAMQPESQRPERDRAHGGRLQTATAMGSAGRTLEHGDFTMKLFELKRNHAEAVDKADAVLASATNADRKS